MANEILVLGATGKTGKRVSEKLEKRGFAVRAGSIIWLMQHLFAEELDGRNESLTHDIENVLGRKPTTFREYVGKAGKTGVWNVQK